MSQMLQIHTRLRDMATGADADFSEERLVGRYNSDLANGLGNLLNRALNMSARYRSGKLSRGGAAAEADEIKRLREVVEAAIADFSAQMEQFQPHAALEALWSIVNAANGLVETSAPFKLAKLTDDAAAQARLDAVLFALADSLRVIGLLLQPVMPDAADGILRQLNVTVPAGDRVQAAMGSHLDDGHQLNAPTPLFPRIETN
jgi:methionyl-tRNA synthetase